MRFSDTADNHMMLLKTLPFSKPKLYNKVSGKWSQDFAGCVWGTVGFFKRGFYTIFEKINDCDLEKLYIKETAFTRFKEEVYCGIELHE